MQSVKEESPEVLVAAAPDSMRVLSVDVGIKNLAFCLLERPPGCQQFSVTQWDTVDLSTPLASDSTAQSDTVSPVCCGTIAASTTSKKGKKAVTAATSSCNKPAKFRKADLCYCLQHAKKQVWQIPTVLDTPAYIQKQSMKGLYEISDRYGLLVAPQIKKTEFIQLLQQHVAQHYYEKLQPPKAVRADDVDLIVIGRNLRAQFDALFLHLRRIDYVIIENQISPIATRMKTIQGMIVQYFLMSGLQVGCIEFVNASNKLKVTGPVEAQAENGETQTTAKPSGKTKYSDRKKQSVHICQQYLQHDFRFQDKQHLFSTHAKQDDLADAFLQGLWFLQKKNHLNTIAEPTR